MQDPLPSGANWKALRRGRVVMERALMFPLEKSQVNRDSKISWISETLCIGARLILKITEAQSDWFENLHACDRKASPFPCRGCGICVKKCPFEARVVDPHCTLEKPIHPAVQAGEKPILIA